MLLSWPGMPFSTWQAPIYSCILLHEENGEWKERRKMQEEIVKASKVKQIKKLGR